MDELTKEQIEKLGLIRNSIMSPYVAQGWNIKADYPQERRVVLTKNKPFSGWTFFLLGVWNWFILGVVYAIYWHFTKEEEKILMY